MKNPEQNIHHNAPRVGDQYYFPKGVSTIVEYRDPIFGMEEDARVLVRKRTVARVEGVNSRNIRLQSEGNRLHSGTNGQYRSEANLPAEEVLNGARRIVTREELFDRSTLRYQAWKAIHERFNPPVQIEYVPVEVVVGPVIPGELPSSLPQEATIVTLPQNSRPTAAD